MLFTLKLKPENAKIFVKHETWPVFFRKVELKQKKKKKQETVNFYQLSLFFFSLYSVHPLLLPIRKIEVKLIDVCLCWNSMVDLIGSSVELTNTAPGPFIQTHPAKTRQ